MKVRRMLLEKFGKKFPMECQQSGSINAKVTNIIFFLDLKLLKNLAGKRNPSEALVNFYIQAISGKSPDLSPMTLLVGKLTFGINF